MHAGAVMTLDVADHDVRARLEVHRADGLPAGPVLDLLEEGVLERAAIDRAGEVARVHDDPVRGRWLGPQHRRAGHRQRQE